MSYRAKPIIAERRLRGQDYSIYIFVSNQDTLTIGIELLESSQYWSSTFSKDSLAAIISKTKLKTTFNDFVELLVESVTNPQRSDTSLDLYTTDDIERTYNNNSFNSFIDSRSYSKRYFILSLETTLVGRVSYPLPLSYYERPDSDYLFAALAKARRSSVSRNSENLVAELRSQIAALEAEKGLLAAKYEKELSALRVEPRKSKKETSDRTRNFSDEFRPLPLSSTRKRKSRTVDDAIASLEQVDHRMDKLAEILMKAVEKIDKLQ